MIRAIFLVSLCFQLLVSKEFHTNDLIHAKSPYLLQHAHNPVAWVPYTKEAFDKAKREKKLVFLSIGYSTCHWCHVMKRESFESEEIAKLLNKGYVSIKIDREEMPQLDSHFQHLHAQLKKGRNGWPLSAVLTAKGEVVYMATYIPPEDNYGIKGMKTLLPYLSTLYHTSPEKFTQLLQTNKRSIEEKLERIQIDKNMSITALYIEKMQTRYDKLFKGFDKRPRFPLASHLNFLLDIYLLYDDKRAWEMVKDPLDAMAKGGIYDQVEGGFFRYSTDPDWIIPHFEKMLYTQAELLVLFSRMYLVTGDALYKKIVKETVEMVDTVFYHDGVFYSATDAESGGREGGYFIYHYEKVKAVLQKKGFSLNEVEENLEYFDITPFGNFEDGYANPHLHTEIDFVPERVEETKQILREIRKERQKPFIDKKVITSWNAMMIKALFEASKVEPAYLEKAQYALETLLKRLYHDKELYHFYISPHKPTQKAFLEDYVFLMDALLHAYDRTYESRYLKLAKELCIYTIEKFYQNGRWYLDEEHFAKARYKDKYYTASLARLFHVMISVANLESDLAFLKQVKGFLAKEKERIFLHVDASPEAARAWLRIQRGDVILKATKKRLLNSKQYTDKIRYPFFLTKKDQVDLYLLCNESSCFFYDKNISKVVEKMNLK